MYEEFEVRSRTLVNGEREYRITDADNQIAVIDPFEGFPEEE